MLEKRLLKYDTLILMTVPFLYFMKTVTGWELLWTRATISAFLLVRYLPFMSKAYKVPAWIFCTIGTICLMYRHVSFSAYAEALTAMLPTVAIVTTMQTLSIAIGLGDYGTAIAGGLRKYAKNQGGLYIWIEVFSHFLCSILNLGEVVIVLNALDGKLTRKIQDYPKFISSAISKGHCTAFLWAPGSITVLLTLQIFKMPWEDYFLPAFFIASLGMVSAGILEYKKGKNLVLSEREVILNKMTLAKIFTVLGIIFLIIVNAILLKYVFPRANSTELLIVDVALVSSTWISFCIINIWKKKDYGKLKQEWNLFSQKTLPSMGSLCMFFVTMGIFSTGMQYIGLEDYMNHYGQFIANLPVWLVLAIVPLIIIAFSLIGIHPMVSLTLIGNLLLPLIGHVSALQLALATAMGCCLSYMVSPFAGLILLLGQQLDIAAKTIALNYNLLHGVLYYILGTSAIYFLF